MFKNLALMVGSLFALLLAIVAGMLDGAYLRCGWLFGVACDGVNGDIKDAVGVILLLPIGLLIMGSLAVFFAAAVKTLFSIEKIAPGTIKMLSKLEN